MDKRQRNSMPIRRDLSNYVIHFTRKTATGEDYEILDHILVEKNIKAGNGFIKGKHKCVCFTETPFQELSHIFELNRKLSDLGNTNRYSQYGVAVSKEFLFKSGGRPVFYQEEDKYSLLPRDLKHLHVSYDPAKNIDFTWEREWRIKGDLKISPDNCFIVAPCAEEAFDITKWHLDENSTRWHVVPIDQFSSLDDYLN